MPEPIDDSPNPDHAGGAPSSAYTESPPYMAYDGYPQQPYAPTPIPVRNGLGLAALIVGIIAVIGAFLPLINFVSWLVALVALVLGIVALCLKNRRKGPAIAGTTISAIALVLSPVLAVAYTTAATTTVHEAATGPSAVETASPSEQSDDPSGQDGAAEDKEDGSRERGTRDNPAPVGTTVTLGTGSAAEWEVTLDKVTLDATDEVMKENTFNDKPEDGMQYAVASLSVTYVGDDSGTPWTDFSLQFVSADGNTFRTSDVMVVGPKPHLSDINELYSGASDSGTVTLAIPAKDANKGTWRLSGFMTEDFFFEAK